MFRKGFQKLSGPVFLAHPVQMLNRRFVLVALQNQIITYK